MRAHPFGPTPPVWFTGTLVLVSFRTQGYPPSSQAQPNLARCLVGTAASWSSRSLQALGSRLERWLPESGQARLPLQTCHPHVTFSRCPKVGAWQVWPPAFQMGLGGLGIQGLSSQPLPYPSAGSKRLESTNPPSFHGFTSAIDRWCDPGQVISSLQSLLPIL